MERLQEQFSRIHDDKAGMGVGGGVLLRVGGRGRLENIRFHLNVHKREREREFFFIIL